MKTFFKVIFSTIFTLLLIGGLFTFAITKAAQSTLTEENLSAALKESMNDIEQLILEDEESMKEIKSAISEVLKEVGLNEDQAKLLFENEDLKQLSSDFISSAILRSLNGETELAIPSEDQISDIVFNNLETLAPLFEIEDTKNVTKEEVQEAIHENYEMLVEQLNNYVNSFGGKGNE